MNDETPDLPATDGDGSPGALPDSWRVHLPVFDGPLDLLLHLIKLNRVEITDIPVATICDQFHAYLQLMEELNLDIAGEYSGLIKVLNMPPSYVILDRVVWGVSAILGRLEATSNWRGVLAEYRKDAPPSTELGHIAGLHWAGHGSAQFTVVGPYDDPRIDAVVVAVPPRFHLELTLHALAAGKHVLVEKPAFPALDDYRIVIDARDRAKRVVLVGENDHYKPLAVVLRKLVAERAIGEMVFAHFTTIAKRFKTANDWRNDERMAGGDAFFEEGIHWLHVAGSLGPRIVSIDGYRPSVSTDGPDKRAKSMMVAFRYDNQAVGSLYYSREIPSLFRGLRLSKLYGRKGIITCESNGLFVLARGNGVPRLVFPGFRDIRGYQAMYRDFHAAITSGRAPEMSLERAMEDQRLMDDVYSSLKRTA